MKENVVLNLTNRDESYDFQSVARQANGAAWVKSGDTVILATVVIDNDAVGQEDFLPLTVQYIEKTYAAGKFPGGFIKRETKPSDFETLTSRIVDRSIRPLFPKGFTSPVQITILVLSVDKESDLQVLALNAASAALFTSDIDVNTSVSALRIAKTDDELIFNPTRSQLADSTLDLFLSGSKDDLLMIEMRSIASNDVEILDMAMMDPLMEPALATSSVTHNSNSLSEDELIEILSLSSAELKVANETYEKEFTPFRKEQIALNILKDAINEEYVTLLNNDYSDKLHNAINQMAKSERSTALRQIRKEIMANNPEFVEVDLKKAIESVKRTLVRTQILETKKRADGRELTEVRPITIETNVLPSAHSSALFTRGQTQALVILTIGGPKDAQMFEDLQDGGTKNENFMVHYNFPGFSVGEPSPVGPPKRRELGHGNLAKRALEPVCEHNRTYRIVSEILESNGSSSMATVCGGYMALKAAQIETVEPIAGVAMGMVSEGDKYSILSDIMGLEDHDGDMDFKVAGSKDGITAMQMDIKLGGISLQVLKEALYQAKEARSHIIDIMLEAEANIEIDESNLPTQDIFNINPDFIGDVIGQAGKTIREIIEKFEVAIDIDKKDGKVKLSGNSKKGVAGAKEHINGIISNSKAKPTYQVGDVADGVVKKIVDFGAFIELEGGVDGLLHISKVSDQRVERVSDVLSEGEKIKVEILEFKGNKISLGRA